MFIQTLPVKIPRALLLIIAFGAGLVVDMFQNTMGMHAAACVFMAYTRPAVLRLMSPRDGYETDASPTVRTLGFTWFLIYASVTTMIHHLVLFYIEVFRFSEFFSTLARVMLSSVASLIVIMIAQYLVSKPVREKA
jgi:rod shape-determining protein MreD